MISLPVGPSISGNTLFQPTERTRRHRLKIVGSDGPYLLLQHGFGTDQDVWHKVLPALLPHFRIILMDLAGAGPNSTETFDPERYQDLEAYADDLLLMFAELGISECLFVGTSVGSMIGMLAAIEQPNLFTRLICLGGSPRYLNELDADPPYLGGFEQQELDALYATMADDYHAWVSGFASLVVRRSAEDDSVKEFSRSLLALRPDIAISTARAIFQSDFRARLSQIQPPVILLHANNDAAVPVEVAFYMSKHIPFATLELIDAEGHFPHLTAPSVVAEAILRHLGI